MPSLRLVVLGMMGRCPFAGQTWLYLNWLSGLNALGHDVYYVEDDTTWPYDPEQNTPTADCQYALRHIATSMERIGLGNRWAFRFADPHCPTVLGGMTEAELRELYRSCDALLNIVGATAFREDHLSARFRVYVETDPVIAELQFAAGDAYTRRVLTTDHHRLVTYGENYGAPDCLVPLSGLSFIKTRQPIDIRRWPMSFVPDAPYFSTIGNYRQEGFDVTLNGETYFWSKHHEWQKVLDLPRRVKQPFRLAMMPDDEADRALLEGHGWQLESPFDMSLDIFGRYPAFIRQSRAEFTVAKDQNVRLRSGWFSERDACYLASGKPVVAQDTGFSNVLPVGEGLFAFRSMDEAVGAVEAVNSDYPRHCRASRAIAEEYFDAAAVARRMLTDVGL